MNPGKKLFGEVVTEAVGVCLIINFKNGFWSTGVQKQSDDTFLDMLALVCRQNVVRLLFRCEKWASRLFGPLNGRYGR